MADLASEFPDLFNEEEPEQEEQVIEEDVQVTDSSQDEQTALSNVEGMKVALEPYMSELEDSQDGRELLAAAESFATFLDSKGVSSLTEGVGSSVEFNEKVPAIVFECYVRYSSLITVGWKYMFCLDKDVLWTSRIWLESSLDTQDLLEWCNSFNKDHSPHSVTYVNTSREDYEDALLICQGLTWTGFNKLNLFLYKYAKDLADEFSEAIE